MEQKTTCRRCSVIRVNLLCSLYDKAYRNNEFESRKILRNLVELAGKKGYPKGLEVLQPGLKEKSVREICWNISSLLSGEDFKHIGNG